MNWVNETLATFGAGMGMANLQLNDQGIACLAFERSGLLTIEADEEHVLVYLGRHLERIEGQILQRALEACHYSAGHGLPLQAGLARGHTLIFAIRLMARDFSPHRLEQVVSLLDRVHETLD